MGSKEGRFVVLEVLGQVFHGDFDAVCYCFSVILLVIEY